MVIKEDLKVGQHVYIFRQGSVDSSRIFEKRCEENVVDEITDDYVITHNINREEKTRKFIFNEKCGLIENKNFFRNAEIFLTKEAAFEFFEKNIMENWFRVKFSKVPHTDYTLDQLRAAKAALEDN